MARIDLDLAHAYRPNPRRQRLRAAAAEDDVRGWRRLRPARPSGCGKTTMLNLISGLLTPSQGTVKFDGRDVTQPQPAGAQHRAGVPVPGDLRHHDSGAEPGLSAAQPQGTAGAGRQAGRRDRRDARAERPARPARRRPGADAKRKISLGRGLVRPTCRRCCSTSR